jgi:hypothetical protein
MKKGKLILSRINRIGIGKRCIVKQDTASLNYVVAEILGINRDLKSAYLKCDGGWEIPDQPLDYIFELKVETPYVDAETIQHSFQAMPEQWSVLLNKFNAKRNGEVEYMLACFEHGRVYAIIPMSEDQQN